MPHSSNYHLAIYKIISDYYKSRTCGNLLNEELKQISFEQCKMKQSNKFRSYNGGFKMSHINTTHISVVGVLNWCQKGF